IDVDPSTKLGVSNVINTYLPGMVAQELYHIRRDKLFGHGALLSEMFIIEGLAQAYREFLYPDVNVIYAHYLSATEINESWKRAKEELSSDKYNHSEWFFGTGSLKRWTGYSL